MTLTGLDDDGNRKEWEMVPLRKLAGAIGSSYDGVNDTKGHLEVVSRLADLIEPSDSAQTVAEDMFGQMRHSTEQERIAYADMMARNSVELHPVDRDALLELADELSGDTLDVPAVYGTYLGGYVAACRDAARRIREALGVES